MALTPAEHRVFAAVADAILPALDGAATVEAPLGPASGGRFWGSSATDLGIAERLPGQVERLPMIGRAMHWRNSFARWTAASEA